MRFFLSPYSKTPPNPVASTANPNGKHGARTCCPFHSIRLPAGVRTQSEGDVLSMADGIDA